MEKANSINRTKDINAENVQNATEKSSEDHIAIISRKKSSSDITTEATKKIILNKTSEDKTLEGDKITQNNLNKTDQSEEKLTVTVRFEVKNNTNLLEIGNMHGGINIEKNESLKNMTGKSEHDYSSIINATLFSHNASTANAISVTTRQDSSSIASSLSSTTVSSSIDLVSNLTASTLIAVNNTDNKRGHNLKAIEKDNLTHKREFSDLPKVTNVWLMTSVTPSALNSTVQSSPKVSVSSSISDTSTGQEINKTGSIDEQPEISSTATVAPSLERLKRSNKKSQTEKKREFVKSSMYNRFLFYLCYSICQDKSVLVFAKLGLHLGFSAKLNIWQVPACKMEPRVAKRFFLSGILIFN